MLRTTSWSALGRRFAPLALAVVPLGCASSGRYIAYDETTGVEAATGVVTFADFLESGRKAVEEHLLALPEPERVELEAMLARCSRACARLAVTTARSGLSYSMVNGSAVLARSSDDTSVSVVSAGHTFTGGTVGTAGASNDVTLTLSDGRSIEIAAVESHFTEFDSSTGDWAVLAIDRPTDDLPSLACRPPEKGELAFLLAYPNQMGVNENGHVVYGEAYRGRPLAPLVTIATVTDTSPLRLQPIAGSLTMGGASGGAIVNRSGELIGALTGSEWTPERNGARYWINGVEVGSFAKRLE